MYYIYQVLGDLVESCIGAILLDSGFDLKRVWKIMLSFLDPIMNFSKLQLSPIRELQELCQSRNWDLQFPTLKKDKEFTVEAIVNGEGICETASATCLNIKAARRMAAKDLFSRLKVKFCIPIIQFSANIIFLYEILVWSSPLILVTWTHVSALGETRSYYMLLLMYSLCS